MDYRQALEIATEALLGLKEHTIDVIEAARLVSSWGDKAKEYSPDLDYQNETRELIRSFPYRLDTNFAKMDRIGLDSLEQFKKNILEKTYAGITISSWSKGIKSCDTKLLEDIIGNG